MLVVLSFCLHTVIKSNYPDFYKEYYRKMFWITLESAITIVFLLYSIIVEKKFFKGLNITLTAASLGMVVAEFFRDLTKPDLFSVVAFFGAIGIIIIRQIIIWIWRNIKKYLMIM